MDAVVVDLTRPLKVGGGDEVGRLTLSRPRVSDLVAAERQPTPTAREAMLASRCAGVSYLAISALGAGDWQAVLQALGVQYDAGGAVPLGDVADEDRDVAADGRVALPLHDPVDGVDALLIAEPTVAQLIECEREQGPTAVEAALVASSAGVPRALVHRLWTGDFFRASRAVGADFFGSRPRSGGGSSSSSPASSGAGSAD